MIELPRTLISFAIVLGVLVFFHELGHYLAARWAGIKVEVFSIGFGPKLFGWTDRLGTEWQLCILPLGGYVKMHGMEQPQDVPEKERAGWHPGETFQGKSVAARSVVVAAGPVANFILAIVLFFGLFAVMGREYTKPEVNVVVRGGAAAAAGLRGGDMITAIDGVAITRFEELQHIVSGSAGKRLIFSIKRKNENLLVPMVPVASGGVGMIGIVVGNESFERVPLDRALVDAVTETYGIARDELAGIGKMITGAESTSDLTGVIGIAQLSGEVSKQGLPSFISFIALLSVSLGLINLFPIPVLDGGHLLFFAVEAVRGKSLSPRVHSYALYLGLTVIALLVLNSARNDLGRLGFFHWVDQVFLVLAHWSSKVF